MKHNATAWAGKIGIGVLAFLASSSLVYAQRPPDSRHDDFTAGNPVAQGSQPAFQNTAMPRCGAFVRAPDDRAPVVVDRVDHGSIRHADAQVVSQSGNIHREMTDAHHESEVRPRVIRRHDVEVDVAHVRFWHNFAFGRRVRVLRDGCLRLRVNGVYFFYDSGIYYQPTGDDYQEVYPPVGAVIPDLPDGAVAIEAGNLVYYFVAGAFYVQQNDGFVIAPPPMGVTVPELPPGSVTVAVNGRVAYQFNGIYYQPVFLNGVTQFMTFMP